MSWLLLALALAHMVFCPKREDGVEYTAHVTALLQVFARNHCLQLKCPTCPTAEYRSILQKQQRDNFVEWKISWSIKKNKKQAESELKAYPAWKN